LLILNKELLEQLNTIKSIFLNKTIAQLILLIITILKVIFLQKRFVLETKILSLSLFIKNLIVNLVIN